MLKPRPKITTILAGKDQRHILKPEFSLRYKPGLWMGIFFLLCNFSLFGNPTGSVMPPCTGPTITLQPRDSTTIVGSGADFFVRASGVGTLTYQWQLKTPQDAEFSNIAVTTRSLVINNAEISANGNQYRVIVSDDNGTPNDTNDDCQVTSNAATLGVTGGVTPCTGPTITLQPRDSTTFVGSGADFFIRASGVGTLTYQWQLKTPQDAEFSNIAVTTRSLVINNVELSANGNQYRVIVSDDNGTPNDTNDDCQVTSNVATLR
ncbi:MAG: immunoglobulin domain-containing protein, partial [Bacteroidota bacterium]